MVYGYSLFFSQTADPRLRDNENRWDPPCGMTQGIEVLCLLCFLTDLVVKVTSPLIPNDDDECFISILTGLSAFSGSFFWPETVSPQQVVAYLHCSVGLVIL